MERFPDIDYLKLRASYGITASLGPATNADVVLRSSTTNRPYADERESVINLINLANDDLTWEQKKFIIEQIMETGRREFEKDSENKRFLDGVFGKLAAAGAAAVVLGVTVLGGKALIQRGGDSK